MGAGHSWVFDKEQESGKTQPDKSSINGSTYVEFVRGEKWENFKSIVARKVADLKSREAMERESERRAEQSRKEEETCPKEGDKQWKWNRTDDYCIGKCEYHYSGRYNKCLEMARLKHDKQKRKVVLQRRR